MCHSIHSGVHRPVCIVFTSSGLINKFINLLIPVWKNHGKVRKFDEDYRVAILDVELEKCFKVNSGKMNL